MIIQILGIISKKKMETIVKPFTNLSVLRRDKFITINVVSFVSMNSIFCIFFILDLQFTINKNKAFYLINLNTFL